MLFFSECLFRRWQRSFSESSLMADLGRLQRFQEIVTLEDKEADTDELQLALSLSSNAGRSEIVAILLAAGADPERYNPPGGHSHCTTLHSAVASDEYDTVVVLVEGKADLSITDIHHGATALDWAVCMKRDEITAFHKSRA